MNSIALKHLKCFFWYEGGSIRNVWWQTNVYSIVFQPLFLFSYLSILSGEDKKYINLYSKSIYPSIFLSIVLSIHLSIYHHLFPNKRQLSFTHPNLVTPLHTSHRSTPSWCTACSTTKDTKGNSIWKKSWPWQKQGFCHDIMHAAYTNTYYLYREQAGNLWFLNDIIYIYMNMFWSRFI